VVADGVVVRERVGHGDLLAHVIAHHLGLMGARVLGDEAVVRPVVELRVALVPAVRRVLDGVVEQVEDGHRCPVRRGVRLGTGEAFDVGAPLEQAQRTEVVIERAVLHHQHDDRVDGREQLFGREAAVVGAQVGGAAPHPLLLLRCLRHSTRSGHHRSPLRRCRRDHRPRRRCLRTRRRQDRPRRRCRRHRSNPRPLRFRRRAWR
jgi:hypothetical protein